VAQRVLCAEILLSFHRSLSVVYSFDKTPLPVNDRHTTLRGCGIEVMLGPTLHQFEHGLAQFNADPGYKEALKQRFLEMQSRQVPVIFSLMHLSVLSGVPWKRLRTIVKRERLKGDYLVYPKQKSSGGQRWICVPATQMRVVQNWIAAHILSSPGAIAHLNKASRAYAKDCSILRNAEQHADSRWMVKIDIHDFFESVSERQVYWVFRRLGYPALLSFEMARICTRVAPPAVGRLRKRDVKWRWNERKRGSRPLVPYETDASQSGHLPQGAPTSPMLSNLIAVELDEQVTAIASEFGGVYTRYADDLIVSFSEGTRAICQTVLRRIRRVLGGHGFVVNRKKTHILGPGARKTVTGLVVNDNQPRLKRQTKNHIEVALHYIETKGLIEHARFVRSKHPIAYLNHLSGLVEFARSIEPVFAGKALQRLEAIYTKNTELLAALAEFSSGKDFVVSHRSQP
jgi:RNA-directed DNA polymerase